MNVWQLGKDRQFGGDWGTAVLALVAASLLTGCGKKDDGPVLTPVKGIVVIDGKPQKMVAVRCHPLKENASAMEGIGQAYTEEDGSFAISTKTTGDGLPAGEYVLTFEWGQMNYISMQYGGPDKLKGRYADAKKSTVKFKVVPGKPVDLGRIELKTP